MEIKVGDKVRVSKNAPIHIIGNASEIKCKAVVLGTDADIAVIGFRTRERQRYDAYKVPTKYLIKVENEAKEPKPKYKAGDKVRVLGHALLEGGVFTITLVEHREERGWMYRINTHTWYPESDLEPYAEPTAPTIKVGSEEWVDKQVWNYKLKQRGVIKRIANGCAEVFTQYGEHKVWSLVDLFDEYDEPFGKWKSVQPKESTEAEKKPNIGSIKIPVEVDLTDSYWDAYTADLAKEIAVKLSKPNENKPGYVADYAVSVAKAVVENLKKK